MKDKGIIYDLTVIVVTYNSSWEKLRRTLNSILYQKKVKIELIIADDGSKNNWFRETTEYIGNSIKVLLLPSEQNMGTVKNIYRAALKASAPYIKTISPGDYFYSEYTVYKWLKYIVFNNSKVSFGRAVYYSSQDGKINIINKENKPRLLKPYHSSKRDNIGEKINYLLCDDYILGATLIYETNILIKYLSRICGKVRYAEDSILRLMFLDDIKINFFDCAVIWYEYGTGISNNNSSKAQNAMLFDWKATNRIIANWRRTDWFTNRIRLLYKIMEQNSYLAKPVKIVLFPSYIFWKVYGNIFRECTISNTEWRFYTMISREMKMLCR